MRFREHCLREEVRGPKAEAEVPRRQSRRDERVVYVRVLASIEREVKVMGAPRSGVDSVTRAVLRGLPSFCATHMEDFGRLSCIHAERRRD